MNLEFSPYNDVITRVGCSNARIIVRKGTELSILSKCLCDVVVLNMAAGG